jgi:hypothetical protein
MPGTDVVVHGAPLSLSKRARDQWDQNTVDLIADSVARGANLPTLYTFLELAARYELDPFAREIWCANMSGRDGAGGQMAILVGRDGYLKIARRDQTFIACPGQAVYSKDEFTAEYVDDDTGWVVSHKITDVADRGEPKGAWARLLRDDRPALFFFAPLEQFKKSGGAWKYEDAMIVKCAQSYLLRTTYGISGAVPYDEVSVGFASGAAVEGKARDRLAVAIPDELRERFDRAAAIDPQSWRANEVHARVYDRDGEELPAEVRKVALELDEWLAANDRPDIVQGGDGPPPADVVDPAAAEAAAAAVAAAAADELTDDERAALTSRYNAAGEPDAPDREREWRSKVDVLADRLHNVRIALDADALSDVGLESDDEANTEIARLVADLERLGVPRSWSRPEKPGDQETLTF